MQSQWTSSPEDARTVASQVQSPVPRGPVPSAYFFSRDVPHTPPNYHPRAVPHNHWERYQPPPFYHDQHPDDTTMSPQLPAYSMMPPVLPMGFPYPILHDFPYHQYPYGAPSPHAVHGVPPAYYYGSTSPVHFNASAAPFVPTHVQSHEST